MKAFLLLAYFLSVVAVASAPDDRRIGCKVVSAKDLALGERTPLDTSARDVLERVEGTHDFALHWQDGRAENARLEIGYRGRRIEYVKQAFDDAGTGQEIALPCDDRLEMEVEFSFETEDTGLKVRLPTTLKSSARDQVLLRVELSPTVLSNTDVLGVSEDAGRSPKAGRLVFETQFTGGEFQGVLYLLSTRSGSEMADSVGGSVELVKEALAHWGA